MPATHHPHAVLATWWRWVICGLLATEMMLFTSWRGGVGYYWSPVLLLLLPTCACVLLLLYARGRELQPASSASVPAWSRWATTLPVAVAGGWFIINKAKLEMRSFWKLDESSDIIVSLQAYARRWVLGGQIYQPLTWEVGYFIEPTYLPAMWFPYAIAELLGVDYRLMALSIFLAGVAGYFVVLGKLAQHWLSTILLGLLPFVLFYKLMHGTFGYIGITVEDMIVGYYSLLIVGILLANWPLQALGLLLCLLSRYSLIFWAPFYLGLVFFTHSRREALLIAGTAFAGVVGFYIIPYLSHNWHMFIDVQNCYTQAAVGEWQHYCEPNLPCHLYNGIGMAIFFLENLTGTILDKVLIVKKVHLSLIVLISLASALVYWRWPRLRIDYRVYAVLTLKIYLAFFYGFVQVPYYYLASVGCFVSVFVVLIAVLLRRADTPASQMITA
jgi:hypothetical protein